MSIGRAALQSAGAALRWAWNLQATKWLFAIGFVVCLLGWVLDARPADTTWGPVASWVGGLATAGGLIFAGLQIRDARQERLAEDQRRIGMELEQRRAMARAVSVSSVLEQTDDGWRVKYTVANGSDYPIDNVVFVVADFGVDDCRPADQVGTAIEIVIGTIHHKQVIQDESPLHMRSAPPFLLYTLSGSVLFTDSWGQSWWRAPGELEPREFPSRMC